jgi:hypothetical protein
MGTPRIVDYTIEKIGALRILLENGTTLDVQLLPVRIMETGDVDPTSGQPLYSIQFNQTIDQRPPEGKIDAASLVKGS